jgi:hypothetical protein
MAKPRNFVLSEAILAQNYFNVGIFVSPIFKIVIFTLYRGADKSLARPGRKQATAAEDFDVHISYLLS